MIAENEKLCKCINKRDDFDLRLDRVERSMDECIKIVALCLKRLNQRLREQGVDQYDEPGRI